MKIPVAEVKGNALCEVGFSAERVVVDPTGSRLWIVDTGSIGFGATSPGGPKLIGVDLKTDQIVSKSIFPIRRGACHNLSQRCEIRSAPWPSGYGVYQRFHVEWAQWHYCRGPRVG